MDGDRKYRQQGYQQDSGRSSDPHRFDRSPHHSPKQPIDITGPKLPRLVQNVAASRCYNCTTTLLPDIQFDSTCPKCKAALHCCKQCVHFDSSTRFQCLKAIPVRIPLKDQANLCGLFAPRVTVARDSFPAAPATRMQENSVNTAPRNATDARAAFDSLFKK